MGAICVQNMRMSYLQYLPFYWSIENNRTTADNKRSSINK